MFWSSCCLLREGLRVEGPVQSKLPQERNGWVRLSAISLCLKRLVSSQIIAARTLKAASDGTLNCWKRDGISPATSLPHLALLENSYRVLESAFNLLLFLTGHLLPIVRYLLWRTSGVCVRHRLRKRLDGISLSQ